MLGYVLHSEILLEEPHQRSWCVLFSSHLLSPNPHVGTYTKGIFSKTTNSVPSDQLALKFKVKAKD